MALKIRRGTNTQRLTITPAEGELIYTTDTKNLYVGDGSTSGGNIISGGGGSGIALTDLSVTDSGGDGSLSYNNTTGVFTYTGPSATEVRSHFTAGTGISISGGVISATGSGGTTYGISAETATGGVNLRLTGSDASTDDVKLAAGSNITLTRTDANTITIDSTGSGSGTVTSVAGTGTVNGLTLSGTVTSSGSLTLGGTLSGIANSALTNSSITINGTAVSLGGTGTINLADLGTVSISSPSNGQVLKYNGTAWVNGTDSTSSGSGIALTDLSATTASGITYNNTTGVFALASIPNTSLSNSSVTINGTAVSLGGTGTINLADLGTVSISSPTNGQVLKYNGTAWVNGTDSTSSGSGIALTDLSVTDSGGDGSLSYNNTTGVFTYTGPSASEVRAHFTAGTGISISSGQINSTITQYSDTDADARIAAASINALSDVTITSPSSGQVLKYNGTAWVNDTDSTGGGGGVTYGISAETATGGVNLRLTGSDASTDNVKLAAGSNITLTRTDDSTITIASSGGGGGSSLQQLIVQVNYDASGNLTSTSVISGSGSATITDATSTVAEVEFTLTGFAAPPLSAIVYGYVRTSNLYSMKHVEATFTTRTTPAGGSAGSPTMFTAWDASVNKPKLSLTRTISLSSAGLGQTTHCVVVFTGI